MSHIFQPAMFFLQTVIFNLEITRDGWCTSMPSSSFEALSCDLTKRLMDGYRFGREKMGWVIDFRMPLVIEEHLAQNTQGQDNNKKHQSWWLPTASFVSYQTTDPNCINFFSDPLQLLLHLQEWKDRFERLQERFPMLSTLDQSWRRAWWCLRDWVEARDHGCLNSLIVYIYTLWRR